MLAGGAGSIEDEVVGGDVKAVFGLDLVEHGLEGGVFEVLDIAACFTDQMMVGRVANNFVDFACAVNFRSRD